MSVQPGQVDPEIVKTVIDSYYTRGVEAADRARDRSERGYTIASAIAAALVAAGVFADLRDRPQLVQVLGLVALGLWLLTALLFIWAVAVPVEQQPDPGWNSDAAFVVGVGAAVGREVESLRKRQYAAIGSTILAMLATVAALALATVQPGGASAEKARLLLTPKADAAAAALCNQPQEAVYATVDPDQLDDPIVTLSMPAGECGADPTTIRVAKESVVAEQTVARFPNFP
jgi:hypothetical protein